MIKMLKQKKAVSLMVSYVLLIVITLSLAVLVYAWLEFTVQEPKTLECPDDVSLIIHDYKCPGSQIIELTLRNKGLWNIRGFIIRGTNKTEGVPMNILNFTSGEGTEIEPGRFDFFENLQPNEIKTFVFLYSDLDNLKKIQIGPFRIQEDEKGKNRTVLCDKATTTQDIENCS